MRMVIVPLDFLQAMVVRHDALAARVAQLENSQFTYVPFFDPGNPPLEASDGEVRIAPITGSAGVLPPG